MSKQKCATCGGEDVNPKFRTLINEHLKLFNLERQVMQQMMDTAKTDQEVNAVKVAMICRWMDANDKAEPRIRSTITVERELAIWLRDMRKLKIKNNLV
jgi:hypothetical protein